MSNSGMLVASARVGLGTGEIMNQVGVLVGDGVVSEGLDFGEQGSTLMIDHDQAGYTLRLDGERLMSLDEADWFGLERACFESAFDAVKAAEVLVKSGRVIQVDLEARNDDGEVVSVCTLWSRLEEL